MNNEDEIVLAAQTERSQSQNKDAAISRLQELVAAALAPKTERRETKVSKAQKHQRLEAKLRQGQLKQLRRPPKGGW